MLPNARGGSRQTHKHMNITTYTPNLTRTSQLTDQANLESGSVKITVETCARTHLLSPLLDHICLSDFGSSKIKEIPHVLLGFATEWSWEYLKYLVCFPTPLGMETSYCSFDIAPELQNFLNETQNLGKLVCTRSSMIWFFTFRYSWGGSTTVTCHLVQSCAYL